MLGVKLPEVAPLFVVNTDNDLFKVSEWAREHGFAGTVRVIETAVGPYGAVDEGGTTSFWFDVGDGLTVVFGKLVHIPQPKLEELSK